MGSAINGVKKAIKAETASPQIRVLMILEYLTSVGPASIPQTVIGLGLSRSSVFRALKILEKTGWVTSNHKHNTYFVTDAYLSLAKDASAFPRVLPMLFSIMTGLHKDHKILSDALYITKTGSLQVAESTDRSIQIGTPYPLSSGLRAATAMSTLSPENRLVAAKTALQAAAKAQTPVRRIEGFSRHLRAIERDGVLWGQNWSSLAIPMIDQRGLHGVLRLHVAKSNSKTRTSLEGVAQTLQAQCHANKYPRLGLFRTHALDATQHLAAQ